MWIKLNQQIKSILDIVNNTVIHIYMNTKIDEKEIMLEKQPKYLLFMSMLYVTAFMFPMMLAYRMVRLGMFYLPGGTVFFPASYFFGDMIAEVYGYKAARQIIWSAIFCQLLLGFLILFVLKMPYPSNWHDESSFDIVLGHSFRYAVASSIGNFFGEFVNIYLISKFKVILGGRYFLLRSFFSTCFGEAVLTLIVFFITFQGVLTNQNIIRLIIGGYAFKCIFGLIAAFPATVIVGILKEKENIDVFDYGVNFNPFRFDVDSEHSNNIKN